MDPIKNVYFLHWNTSQKIDNETYDFILSRYQKDDQKD